MSTEIQTNNHNFFVTLIRNCILVLCQSSSEVKLIHPNSFIQNRLFESNGLIIIIVMITLV
jgi:hypothetical protein